MSKKEMDYSGVHKINFAEEQLFDRLWHIKVLSIIFGLLIITYILLKLFL